PYLYTRSLHDALPIFRMVQELDSDLLAGEGRETISHIYITCGRDAIVHDRCEDSARCIGDVRVLPVEDNSIGRKPLPPEAQYRRSEEHTSELQSRGHL